MELDPSVSSIITGIIIPFVLPLLMQTKWSSKTKSLITFAVAIIAGVVNAIISGNSTDIAVVLMSVVTVYQSLNKTGVFNTISEATDIKSKKVDAVPNPPEDYKAGE